MVSTVSAALCAQLFACGSDGGGGNKHPDSGIHLMDSGGGGSDSGGSAACSAAASYAPNFGAQQVAIDQGSGSGYQQELEWQGELSPTPEVFIDLRAFAGGGSGSNQTPDWPTGNVTPKSNLDLSTSADVLMIIGANLNGSGVAQDLYLATAGTVNITQVTPDFAGDASGLMFQHVDIDAQGNITADPDNCASSIASMSFDGKFQSNAKAGAPRIEIQQVRQALLQHRFRR